MHPHRRRNPLDGSWVLVSPQRNLRPWSGQRDAPDRAQLLQHDPACPLCSGNVRANGLRNPVYTGVHAFDNDFPALLPDTPDATSFDDELFARATARGGARVLCFSSDHGMTLARMPVEGIERVVDAWCDETAALARQHRWVQVFENKGAMMGCSNPHPHGQVWACDHLPREAALEDTHQRAYYARHGRPMLLDVAQREAELAERVVVETASWLALVPHWAAWPFETLLLPRFPVRRLPELTAAQRADLALALSKLLARYDNLFDCSFPYSMGWHGAPFDPASRGETSVSSGTISEAATQMTSSAPPSDDAHWQLHAHFFPPLLRSATVRKFMVGFELLGETQRDLTPEQAAAKLRAVSDSLDVAREGAT
ncbi:MAG TPA: UDP-glucose--hexose-1-phosphate uridylyltransferase [Burkholderiaceae bacterium]|nr:UDP-glucose--hexose-1-phosphate uridylyltransferase [Burkholderiaceae bacterium]